MSDACRYAVLPDPRSRSRALQSCKSGNFQKLFPLPFTMGAGIWPLFLNYGTISKFDGAGFFIFGLVFVSRDFEVGPVRPLRRVDRQSHMGLMYLWLELVLWHWWFRDRKESGLKETCIATHPSGSVPWKKKTKKQEEEMKLFRHLLLLIVFLIYLVILCEAFSYTLILYWNSY